MTISLNHLDRRLGDAKRESHKHREMIKQLSTERLAISQSLKGQTLSDDERANLTARLSVLANEQNELVGTLADAELLANELQSRYNEACESSTGLGRKHGMQVNASD